MAQSSMMRTSCVILFSRMDTKARRDVRSGVKMGRTRVEHMSSALPPESRHNGDATALPVGRNGYAAPIRSRAVLMSTSHGGKGHCSLRHRHRRARPDMATLVYQIFLGFRACHRDTNRSTIY